MHIIRYVESEFVNVCLTPNRVICQIISLRDVKIVILEEEKPSIHN